jgi:hypothetical protein
MSPKASQKSRATGSSNSKTTPKSAKETVKVPASKSRNTTPKSAVQKKNASKTVTKKTNVKTTKTTTRKVAPKAAASKNAANKKNTTAKTVKTKIVKAAAEKDQPKKKRSKTESLNETVVNAVVEAAETEAPKKRGRAKSIEIEDDLPEKGSTTRKKRTVPKSLTEEFLEEDSVIELDDDLDPDLVDLDPLDTLVVLDPELEDEPSLKPKAPPVSKPKVGKLAPRMQTCDHCGKSFPWLSADRLCFNCLKKKIAQKRSDETYGSVSDDDGSGF